MTEGMTRRYDQTVEWFGSHSVVTLSRLLKRIAQEEKSGDLQVAFADATKTVHLKQGLVVFAASSIQRDRLGEAMLERGSISEREFLVASNLVRTEGRRFGEALLRMGLLCPQELEDQLCFQFNRIILSLFRVNDGVYSFEERLPSIPDELMVRIPVPYLLLRGLRNVNDKNLLLTCLPSPQQELQATTRVFHDFDICSLRPNEMRVLSAARTGASVESILERVGGEYDEVLTSCGTLYLMGLLQPKNETLPYANLEGMITESHERTDRMSELQILGVPAGAGREEVEKAYLLQRLEWTHIHRQVADHPRLEPMVSEILFRMAAAYHSLVTERPQPSPGTAATPPRCLPASMHGNDWKAPTETGEKDRGKGKERRRPKARLLRELKANIEARNWPGAIPILFDLIEIEPGNAAYRGLLGKAMFKHPAMRKNAERHLLEATRLSPESSDLYTWLGLYYESFGTRLQAASAFRTALKLDPSNKVARKHLTTGAEARGHLKDPFRRDVHGPLAR